MPLSPIEILSSQLKEAHEGFLATLEGTTDEQANFQPQGKALSIAAIWTHLIESEDMFLSAISGQPTIESTGSPDKFGFSAPQPMENWAEEYPKWAHQVKVHVAPLTNFTKQVFEASEKFIAGLTPEKLEQTKDLGSMGSPTIEHIVSAYMIGHCYSITGEVSAIKGVQGLKGYPW
jgi:hypothetical protein